MKNGFYFRVYYIKLTKKGAIKMEIQRRYKEHMLEKREREMTIKICF